MLAAGQIDDQSGESRGIRVRYSTGSGDSQGAIQATRGGKDPSYLVSKASYRDFELRAEFWSSDDANSGVFLRCQDRGNVTDENCYEANIFDQRPDPTYGTGAIVKVAKVSPMPRAGDRWNVMEVTARGTRLTVTLNGQKTVEVDDSKLASGPIALERSGFAHKLGGRVR